MDEIKKRRDPRIVAARVVHQGPGQASKVAMDLIKAKGVDFVGVLDSDPVALLSCHSGHGIP